MVVNPHSSHSWDRPPISYGSISTYFSGTLEEKKNWERRVFAYKKIDVTGKK